MIISQARQEDLLGGNRRWQSLPHWHITRRGGLASKSQICGHLEGGGGLMRHLRRAGGRLAHNAKLIHRIWRRI